MQNAFSLDRQKVIFTGMKIRPELKEANPLPDIDLLFSIRAGSEFLAMIAPEMRSFLYKQGDQESVDGEPGLTALRFPELGTQHIKKEIVGGTTTVHYGVGEVNGKTTDIEIDECTVDSFSVDPMEGGTVLLAFRIRCKPTGEENGRLTLILGREVELTVEPPQDPQQSLDLDD